MREAVIRGALERGGERSTGRFRGAGPLPSLALCFGLLLASSGTASACGDDGSLANPPATELCGNGVLDPSEECDGSNMVTASCNDLGFVGGVLACTDDCKLDTSQCIPCGPEGRVCDGECVDVSQSFAHCGTCGVSCLPRQSCVAGSCRGHSALTPIELLEALEHKDFMLINVRVPPWGMIPGTDANVSDEEPDQLVEAVGPDLAARVVVYCRTNPRALNAINHLSERGYDGICYLEGGTEAWAEAGYELE